MRMGLHGSVSVGGLSALSQSGGRSRSGTGSWSGLGRGDGTSWPCAFARGGAGTPPMTSTSWTKMSVATRAARFASAHERSPAQPSTAEIFSAPDTPDRRDNVVSSPRSRVADSIRGAKDSSSDDVRHRKSDAPFRDFRQHPLRTSTGEPKRVGEAKTSTNGSSVPPPALGDRDAGAHSSSKTAELDTRNAHDHESVQDGSGAYLSDAEYDLMCRREDRPCIFAPKTICVISRFPIYGVLRRFLRHLYAISLSRSGVPLERYISMFVSCIPMPPPGKEMSSSDQKWTWRTSLPPNCSLKDTWSPVLNVAGRLFEWDWRRIFLFQPMISPSTGSEADLSYCKPRRSRYFEGVAILRGKRDHFYCFPRSRWLPFSRVPGAPGGPRP